MTSVRTRFTPADLVAFRHPAIVVFDGTVVGANDQASSSLERDPIGLALSEIALAGHGDATSALSLDHPVPGPPLAITVLAATGARQAESSVYPVVYHDRPSTLLIWTESSRVVELRIELGDAIETKEGFAARVAHEIKNPLTGVTGLAQILRNETAPSDEQAELLELIIDGAADIQRIVGDLMALSDSAEEPSDGGGEPVDLRSSARSVIEALKAVSGVSVSLSGHGVCVGDEGRIRQVLRNLISNAVRYGGPDIRMDIGDFEDRVRVEVSDDGEGVPAEFVESMFDNFTRAHHTVRESMGVGLAVVRQLVVGMGGSLSYSRRDGRTVFTVDLPSYTPSQ